MRSMWKGIAAYNNLTAQKLGVTEMAALNQFMCGLSPNEISQLNKEAFKFVLHTSTHNTPILYLLTIY